MSDDVSKRIAEGFAAADAACGARTVKVGAGHDRAAQLRARKLAFGALTTKLDARTAADVVADERTAPQEFLESLRDAVAAAADKPFAQAVLDVAATCVAAAEAAILRGEV